MKIRSFRGDITVVLSEQAADDLFRALSHVTEAPGLPVTVTTSDLANLRALQESVYNGTMESD